jgi:hypothetical protein
MLARVATGVATTFGFHCIGLDSTGKEKTRKALRHAGFRIALVLIGPVFGGAGGI